MDDEVAAERLGSVVDGRYRLIEVVATGAMGAVYKAERVPVGKLVAVKFLHASVAQDDEFQTRFERETHAMSKLSHPNCVSVLDFGVWEGAPYLVMDYVSGTTLRDVIDRGPVAVVRALGLARQIAAGLAHAHEQGVVHRDIKPANIVVTDEIGHGERVRILDFGLARLRAAGDSGRDATRSNMVVGTPNYMAPEQTIPGNRIDHRADIYAVGVVLFEMIAGERPFVAEETLQLLGMHRAAPVPKLADRMMDRGSIPSGLQPLVEKAMAKSSSARFQTALELAAAIDEVLADGLESKAEPTLVAAPHDDVPFHHDPEPRQRVGWRGAFAAMAIIGGAVAMASYLTQRNPNGNHAASNDRMATRIAVTDGSLASQAAIDNPGKAGGDERAALIDAIMPPIVDAAASQSDAAAATDAGRVDEDVEIEMDPSTAEDLDPGRGSGTVAEDEAENAPKTPAEAERHVPTPPQLAGNLRDAVQLIVAGKRELALASLRALHKKSPKSAYIPFLLGNLYFDQRWWSVALDFYGEAISKNSLYRRNPVINRNVINMLSSAKTRQRATNFIRGKIGHPAAPYLRTAAAHGVNPAIRKQAASLSRIVR